jgi:hypothetical protein
VPQDVPSLVLLLSAQDIALCEERVFFCFVFFVATKKMTLLSGNPDGSAFVAGSKV